MEIFSPDIARFLIPLTVFLLMICVGFEMSLSDFRRVLVYPRAVVTGIVGQIILLPLMAFSVAALFTDDPIIQIGIVLLAACPGGPLSNSFVYLARARAELSVTMTAVNGFLALVSTPLIASLGIRLFAGEDSDINLPILKTMAQIFSLAIVPIVIGMWVKARYPVFALERAGVVRKLAVFLLISHICLVVFNNYERLGASIQTMMLPAMLFVILAQAMGYFSAKAVKLDDDTCFTISVEVGLQNVVLAILIADFLLGKPEYGLFVLNYAAGVLFLMFPLIFIYRRKKRSSGELDLGLQKE